MNGKREKCIGKIYKIEKIYKSEKCALVAEQLAGQTYAL